MWIQKIYILLFLMMRSTSFYCLLMRSYSHNVSLCQYWLFELKANTLQAGLQCRQRRQGKKLMWSQTFFVESSKKFRVDSLKDLEFNHIRHVILYVDIHVLIELFFITFREWIIKIVLIQENIDRNNKMQKQNNDFYITCFLLVRESPISRHSKKVLKE